MSDTPNVVPILSVPRALTPAQKARVRDALDDYYDEQRGCYRDGKSDAIIGHDLGVPWACVEQMREAAYGPLLIDPEVEALQREYAAMSGKIESAEKKVTDALSVLDAAAKDAKIILGKIEALAQRRRSRP